MYITRHGTMLMKYRNKKSAPPITVLGWIVQRVHEKFAASPWRSTAAAIIGSDLEPRQHLEEDDHADDHERRQEERRPEHPPEDRTVELQMHVEQDDDRELRGRQHQ